MNHGRPVIPFLLDENVADAVGDVLRAAGHDVRLEREILLKGADDAEVAAATEASGRVLVSHDRDFRPVGRRIGLTRLRLLAISRVRLECTEPEAARRIDSALSLIEHEWMRSETAGGPMVVSLGSQIIRSHR